MLAERFGAPELQPATGGASNYVFHARAGGEALVVHAGNVAKQKAFERERLVTSRVRETNVPAPEVLAIDVWDGFAVMISRAMTGEIARDHPNRLRTLNELGTIAARHVHTLHTSGFGDDFAFGPEVSQKTWRDWLSQ